MLSGHLEEQVVTAVMTEISSIWTWNLMFEPQVAAEVVVMSNQVVTTSSQMVAMDNHRPVVVMANRTTVMEEPVASTREGALVEMVVLGGE